MWVNVSNQPAISDLHSILDAEGEDEVLGGIYDRRVVARLPSYLARVRSWMVAGAAGVAIRSLASLAQPYLVGVTIDSYIQNGNLAGLNFIIGVFVAASLLAWFGGYLEERFLAFAGDRILLILRTEMFDHLQELSLSFFDRNKVGTIMSRVQSDVQQLQQLITGGLLNIITSALTLVGIAVVMLVLDARLALLTLTVLPVLAVATIVWQRYARRTFVKVRRAIAAVNSQLQEGISGVRVTQSLSREDVNLKRFDAMNRTHLEANIDATRMTSVTTPVVDLLTAIATALVIGVGGFQVINGQMGVGVLLAFLLYVQRFFNPVLELAAEYTELQRAMVAGSRIFGLLDVEPEIKDSPHATGLPPVKGEIRFHDVSFGYQLETEVLHDINLTIRAGENVAIVGSTGAGKSSLVNLIARFYEVNKGHITIDGHDIRSVTQDSLRRQMGIVPQDPFLFSGTIEENIRYGRAEATREDVINAARTAGAHDFITRLDRSYHTAVGERGVNLSAGQRQFICLARAVLLDPPVLVLDEATSNIDTTSERLMQRSLRRLVEGRTCIVIAHRLSTVTDADRIIVLDRGRIVEAGSHQELLAGQSLYFRMYQALSDPVYGP